MTIDRREFIKRAGLVGGAAAAMTALPGCRRLFGKFGPNLNGPGLLQIPARHSPVDHVVVLMMENRSFDHWLGWLAEDHAYLEAGRRRYGRRFNIDGNQHQTFQSATGPVQTERLVTDPDQTAPFQGCGFGDPGHSWTQGRAQRDGGFLAPGSRNDEFALGYYIGDDLPFTSQLAKQFTTFDRYHASLLGPTWPNREYLHSAQSGGQMSNNLPTAGLSWESIWTRLIAADVPSRYYYSDLPFLALFGSYTAPLLSPIENFHDDCAAGTLPNVVFLDPKFVGPEQCDDHPLADIRRGQAFVRDAFKSFAQSKHWHNGAFIVTYDEWGGFFDHVPPAKFADDRASTDDALNFGQGGFRVPTIVASPFARPGFVDHRTYEHTSILRFLEWRFLGAPPEGPGKTGDSWFLTSRDRNANNIGASLMAKRCSDDIGFDLDVVVPPPAPACAEGVGGLMAENVSFAADDPPIGSMQQALDRGDFERVNAKVLV
jgi:phospholipase C